MTVGQLIVVLLENEIEAENKIRREMLGFLKSVNNWTSKVL